MNNKPYTISLDGEVSYYDSDGFVLDHDYIWNFVIPSGETATYSDYSLVNTSLAARIDKCGVHLEVD